MIRRLLNRLADFLLADALAEHAQVGRPDLTPRPTLPHPTGDTANGL